VKHGVGVRGDRSRQGERFRHSTGLHCSHLYPSGTKLLLRELYVTFFAFVVFALIRMRSGVFAFVAMSAVVVLTTGGTPEEQKKR